VKSGPHTSRRRRFQRKGISLGELLIVMSAAMIILTISATLMHRIMHTYSKTRAFVDVERTSLRLANTFRSDVHQATAATTTDPPASGDTFLRLTVAGSQRVEYRRDKGTITRVLLDGDRLVSRETFALSPAMDVVVKKDGDRLVALAITAGSGEGTSTGNDSTLPAYAIPVNVRIEAVLNRDAFAAAATPQRGGR
jgi:hypothetical protein